MSQVVIYGRTHPICPFCIQAKKMAEKAGLDFEYKDLTKGDWTPESVAETLGVMPRTVPIVVVNGEYLGGAKELAQFIRGNFS